MFVLCVASSLVARQLLLESQVVNLTKQVQAGKTVFHDSSVYLLACMLLPNSGFCAANYCLVCIRGCYVSSDKKERLKKDAKLMSRLTSSRCDTPFHLSTIQHVGLFV